MARARVLLAVLLPGRVEVTLSASAIISTEARPVEAEAMVACEAGRRWHIAHPACDCEGSTPTLLQSEEAVGVCRRIGWVGLHFAVGESLTPHLGEGDEVGV